MENFVPDETEENTESCDKVQTGNAEPKICDIEELFEGYGREKISRTDTCHRMMPMNTQNSFLKSLAHAFGTSPADITHGQTMIDILATNYSGIDRKELCKQVLELVQNSLQNFSPHDGRCASNFDKESLLRLQEFLSSYLKKITEDNFPSADDFPSAHHSPSDTNVSFNSHSSLGILDISDVSDFTGDSNEKNKDESYLQYDPAEYLNEIEDLQHQNKKLCDENVMFKSQLSSSEEFNQLLIQENAKLKKEIKTLQGNLKEIAELQAKNEVLKCSLANNENTIKVLSLKLEEVQKEKESLNESLILVAEKLQTSQLEVESKQQILANLSESHQLQKVALQKLCQEKDEAEKELIQVVNKNVDLELAIKELNDANQSLREDKNLVQAELETTKQRLESVLEKVGYSGGDVSLNSSCSPNKSNRVGRSICCEISNILSSESLPTPFCGKASTASSRRRFYSIVSSSVKTSSKKRLFKDTNKEQTVATSHSVKRLTSTPAPASIRRKRFGKQMQSKDFDTYKSFSEGQSVSPGSGDVYTAWKSYFSHEEQKYDHKDVSGSKNSSCGGLNSSNFEDVFLKQIVHFLHLLGEYACRVYVQAKQGLGLDLDILETKLLDAKQQSESKIELKAVGESNMPPQEYNITGLEQDEKLVYDLASNNIQQQICVELKALKNQLVRSHALLSYLEKEKYASASPDLFSEKILDNRTTKSHLLQQKSFDAHTSNYFQPFSNNHRSTPLHQSYRAQSCPTFIDDLSCASKSTQTEIVADDVFSNRSSKVSSQPGHMKFVSLWNRNKDSRYSECSSTSEVSSKSVENLECGICEVHHLQKEAPSPCLPRHRTNSFLSAVARANNQSAVDSCDTDLSCSTAVTEGAQAPDARRRNSLHSRRVVKIAEHENQKEKMIKVYSDEGGASSMDTSIDKNKNGKDKSFKMSQRSMRRGSGAGSPNSLTTIPRYPAFDLDEQDEEHSLPITTSSTKKVEHSETAKTTASEVVETITSQSKESSQTTKECSQRKPDYSRTSLMPEVVENSETESAKGSFEYESTDAQSAVTEAPPIPVPDVAFPNLPDTLLSKLGISKDSSFAVESCDEQEIERKFMTLSLAFKTDKMTLSRRLEIQKRQRDITEKDAENEIKAIKESLKHLSLNAATSETRDLIAKIQTHVDIVSLATSKVSARSETYGAVKQEERVNCAFEVMLHYVENLRRLFDKEHRELEETKRILTGTQASHKKISHGDSSSPDEHKKSLKTFGLAIGTVKSDTRSRLISALMPFSSSSSIGLNSNSSSTHLCTTVVPSSLSSQVTGCRRCSLPASCLSGSPLPSKFADSRRKDAYHLGRSPSDMKISVAPSLSSVVDEERSDEEVDEESSLVENNEVITTDNMQTIKYEYDLENPLPRMQENEVIQQEIADSPDEGILEISVNAKNVSVLQRIGFPHVLHIWKETSAFNLLRYTFSLLLGLSALIILIITFLPSENCSADEEFMFSTLQKLHELLNPSRRHPPVV